jgi:hypothetical protein
MSKVSDIFLYDKDNLISLDKQNKKNFIQKFINNLVHTINDNSLIVKEQQPSENYIYKLYSDGTLTREKGGWAYGKRNTIDIEYEILRPHTFFTFPYKGQYEGDTYAILTLENSHKVRELMNELLLHI